MKIVLLDAKFMNPGDLDFSHLNSLGDVTIFPNTSPQETIKNIGNSDIVLTNKVIIDKNIIDQLHPTTKYIIVTATGYNNVDTAYAKSKGIIVSNIPAYSTNSVAQLVFAFILEHYSRVAQYNTSVHSGDWVKSGTFTYMLEYTQELAGKTIGIFGFGAIGNAIAKIAAAFEMNIIITTRTPNIKLDYTKNYKQTNLYDMVAQADIVTLHAPLTDNTRECINKEVLSKMKKSAILVNTGRGALLNEQDVAEALNNDVIAGAYVDVLSVEPPPATNPLLTAKNCTITPHIAWASKEARTRALHIIEQNITAYTSGSPINVVNN